MKYAAVDFVLWAGEHALMSSYELLWQNFIAYMMAW